MTSGEVRKRWKKIHENEIFMNKEVWKDWLVAFLCLPTMQKNEWCCWINDKINTFLFMLYHRTVIPSYRHSCSKSYECVYVLSLTRVQLFAAWRTVACQAPLPVGFFWQKYWNGVAFPTPWNLNDPGIKPTSLVSPLLAGKVFTTSATWEAQQVL